MRVEGEREEREREKERKNSAVFKVQCARKFDPKKKALVNKFSFFHTIKSSGVCVCLFIKVFRLPFRTR